MCLGRMSSTAMWSPHLKAKAPELRVRKILGPGSAPGLFFVNTQPHGAEAKPSLNAKSGYSGGLLRDVSELKGALRDR